MNEVNPRSLPLQSVPFVIASMLILNYVPVVVCSMEDVWSPVSTTKLALHGVPLIILWCNQLCWQYQLLKTRMALPPIIITALTTITAVTIWQIQFRPLLIQQQQHHVWQAIPRRYQTHQVRKIWLIFIILQLKLKIQNGIFHIPKHIVKIIETLDWNNFAFYVSLAQQWRNEISRIELLMQIRDWFVGPCLIIFFSWIEVAIIIDSGSRRLLAVVTI